MNLFCFKFVICWAAVFKKSNSRIYHSAY